MGYEPRPHPSPGINARNATSAPCPSRRIGTQAHLCPSVSVNSINPCQDGDVNKDVSGSPAPSITSCICAAANLERDVDSEVVQIAQDLIRMDTSNYAPDPSPGERQAAEYIAALLDEVGIESKIYESAPGRATLVAHWEPEGVDRSCDPLLIHCHTDVVPANADEWTVPPFSGEIHDGYLWGRGAIDMKGFDAMLLNVVRSRQREGRPPRRPIRLIFFADEEAAGGLGSVWLANNHPEELADCSLAISEVGGFSVTVKDDLRLYLVSTAEKGLHWFRLIADGRAGHGSMRNAENAVTELAKAVCAIGQHRWPERIHPSHQAFIDTIEELLDVKITYDNAEETLARLGSISRMVGAAMSNTVNPTGLAAGYKANVIPGQATATFDGRFIPGYETEMLETIRELIGPNLRMETIAHAPAAEADFACGLLDAMEYSLRCEDPQARVTPYLPSTGTDGKNFAERFGINNFGFTPMKLPADLDFTALFHGVDERIPVESLSFGAKVLDHFLDRA